MTRKWIVLLFFLPLPLFAGEAEKDTVSLLFTGDILFDRGVRQRIEHIGIEHLFSKGIDSLFHEADYVVGNLECPATKTVQPNFKQFVFRAEPEWLSTLHEHHITHLNLANNHSIDQGRTGLVDTWQNVRKAGITPVGAGMNMDEAVKPVLVCNHPRPVWLFASLRLALENYSYLPDKPCVSQENIDSLCQRISLYVSLSPKPTSSSASTGEENIR